MCVDTSFAQTRTVVSVEKDELYTEGRGEKIRCVMFGHKFSYLSFICG